MGLRALWPQEGIAISSISCEQVAPEDCTGVEALETLQAKTVLLSVFTESVGAR